MICKTDMNIRKTVFAVLVLLLSATVTRAQYQQVNDISYTESSDSYAKERCKLDVYYPTELKDAPVVVWFHGGGIEGGNGAKAENSANYLIYTGSVKKVVDRHRLTTSLN